MSKNGTKKLPKIGPKSDPKWAQKVTQNGTNSYPKRDQKVTQNGTKKLHKIKLKSYSNGTQSYPQWDQKVTQMGPKSNPNGTEELPKMGQRLSKWDQKVTQMEPKNMVGLMAPAFIPSAMDVSNDRFITAHTERLEANIRSIETKANCH